MKKLGMWMILGGILFALLPLGIVILAGIPASIAGCQVDEGSVHPCNFLGFDIGELLYAMFVMGWFSLLTFPLGGGITLLGVLLTVITAIKKALHN